MVIGAGPAGMGAAIAAAERGHESIIYEERDFLGGQFALAVKAPGKQMMSRVLDSLVRRLEYSEVIVQRGRKVDRELVEQERSDVVILATGARQRIPKIENLDSQRVLTSVEYFEGSKQVVGNRILVIGAGMVGMEAAEQLVNAGKTVVATKRSDTIAMDMDPINRSLMMKRLAGNPNLEIMVSTTVLAFSEGGVQMTCNGDKIMMEPFDTVLVCSGLEPDLSLRDAIEDLDVEVHIIGDASGPSNIEKSFNEGLKLGDHI